MRLFRTLNADEIDVKMSAKKDKEGNFKLFLYKDARVDQNILDETVGPLMWQKELKDNICTVAIYNKELKEWIKKSDVGSAFSDYERDKSIASDAFKRACINWGIGRELYTAAALNLVISENDIKNLSFYEKNGEKYYQCNDNIIVKDIRYNSDDNEIISILLAISDENDNIYFEKNFSLLSNEISTEITTKPMTATVKAVDVGRIIKSIPLEDDEIILMGNCKGKSYISVKDSIIFYNFIKWARNSNIDKYKNDKEQDEQFRKIKTVIDAIPVELFK